MEKAACNEVKAYFKKRKYSVHSREKENLGYDFDVVRDGKIMHAEVKGVSGSLLIFPITSNEVACARSDRAFHLAVVTEARKKPFIHLFTAKEFLKRFKLKPLAFYAEHSGNK